MDPLSLVASVIAVAGAAGQIGKVISRLRHFGEVPSRIYALKNEISDLEIVLRQVADALDQQSLLPDSEHGSLEQILLKIQANLTDLAKALDRVAKACENGKFKSISKTTIWWKEKALFESFRANLHSTKSTLNLMLGVSNSRDLSHVILELRKVTVLSSTTGQMQESISRDQQNDYVTLGARIDDQYQDLSSRLDSLGKLILNGQVQSLSPTQSSHAPVDGTDSQSIRVIASPRVPCRNWCPCACHLKRKMKLATPTLVESVLGRVFIGYSGTPVLNKPCDFRGCQDRQTATATVEYWFPWWIVAMNLKLNIAYLARAGPQLQLTTTTRVPDDSESIRFAMTGNIPGLQYLFTQGKAGPRDVSNSRGYSLMRWALYGGMHNYETVQFLIRQGATVDEISYDNVWDFTFRNKCNENEIIGLRCITEGGEGDWVNEQNFPLIHRIVFGLSDKALVAELDENPNAIYATDAQNRTALDWATARVQLDHMKVLIMRGSNPNNMDITGRTAVLHAVDSHNFDALRLILEAGGNPDPVYPKGIFRSSPLTAAGFAGRPDLLKLLLQAEAKPNACNPEGLTALHSVASTHNIECASLLLEFGADLNASSAIGRTPLTIALNHNNHPVLQLFCDHCLEYLNTMRFDSPRLLSVIAETADIQSINIIAASNPAKFTFDLEPNSVLANIEVLRGRPDFSEKLLESFEELIVVVKAEAACSRTSLDTYIESGFYLSAKSSFHSELNEAFAQLESALSSPVEDRRISPTIAHFRAKRGFSVDSPATSEKSDDRFEDSQEDLISFGEKPKTGSQPQKLT